MSTHTPRPAPPTAGRTWGFVLAGVAAVTYQSWLLAPLVGARVPWLHAYVSELAALDQPRSWLFRTGDLITGALLVLAVAIVLGRTRLATDDHQTEGGRGPRPRSSAPSAPRDVRRLIGWLGVAGFAVATIVDAVWPMSCAPSLSPGCVERSGTMPVTDVVHQAASVFTVATLALACLALSWGRPARRHSVRARRTLQVLALGFMIMSAMTGIEGLRSDLGDPSQTALGRVQRLMVLLAAAWWTLVAWLERTHARVVAVSADDARLAVHHGSPGNRAERRAAALDRRT